MRPHQPSSTLREFAVSFACWTGFCLVLGGQLYVGDRAHNNFLPLFHYVIWPGLLCYSWALLTPPALAFYRQHPFTQTDWPKRLGQVLLATLAIICVHSALQGFGGWLYTHEASLGTFITNTLIKYWVFDIQTSIFLFVLAAHQRAREESRYRQIHEAQLEARVASAELEMLRIQVHPHFLFNTLQAATVLLHEDPQAAEDVLLRLSELLRIALDEMRNQEVSLEKELAFLDLYLGIQRQRFKDRLQVQVTADPQTLHRMVPSLILQPLVENAVHHGIGKHKGTDSVEISAHTGADYLELEVRNYASSLQDKAAGNGHGVGLRNIRARLEQMYGDSATLEMRPILPHGVSARIRIPLTPETAAS